MPLGTVRALLKDTYTRWSDHNAPRLGAALAYYTLLSISPLLLLLTALLGFILQTSVAEQRILTQAEVIAGPQAAATVHALIQNTKNMGSSIEATVIALVTLFFGASGAFLELRTSLNVLWDAPQVRGGGWSAVKDRLVGFGMVLGAGVFVLVSALVSAGFAIAEKFASDYVPVSAAILGEIANVVLSVLILGVLFATMYRVIPTIRLPWRSTLVGALVTAVLFLIGRALLTLYLTKASVGSTYGAAGSIVAFVVWVYYSAQIFFFGAVFTRVYASSALPLEARRAAVGIK